MARTQFYPLLANVGHSYVLIAAYYDRWQAVIPILDCCSSYGFPQSLP